MRNCSEKFSRWHRLSSLCGPPGGRGGPPHQPFHALRVGQRPMRNCLEKFKVQSSRLVVCPSGTFHNLGVGRKPMNDCSETLLSGGIGVSPVLSGGGVIKPPPPLPGAR